MLIDTHCHLNFKAFKGVIENNIDRAKQTGVKKIIVPGTNLETSQKAVKLALKYGPVYASIGIHPHHALSHRKIKPKIINQLEKLAKNKKVVAIGECGLDYYHYQKTQYKNYQVDKNFKACQKKLFSWQIELASKLKLPLIIHNRQASLEVLKIIKNSSLNNKNLTGVFHCFQGSLKLLNWILKSNFYLGITGIVSFNKNMQQLVKKTPLNKILIETDAPYLLPKALKSKNSFPNEPKNVKIVAQWIAKIKGDSFFKIESQTSKNAIQLFRLKNG